MIMAMVMTMAPGQGDGNDRGLLDLFASGACRVISWLISHTPW